MTLFNKTAKTVLAAFILIVAMLFAALSIPAITQAAENEGSGIEAPVVAEETIDEGNDNGDDSDMPDAGDELDAPEDMTTADPDLESTDEAEDAEEGDDTCMLTSLPVEEGSTDGANTAREAQAGDDTEAEAGTIVAFIDPREVVHHDGWESWTPTEGRHPTLKVTHGQEVSIRDICNLQMPQGSTTVVPDDAEFARAEVYYEVKFAISETMTKEGHSNPVTYSDIDDMIEIPETAETYYNDKEYTGTVAGVSITIYFDRGLSDEDSENRTVLDRENNIVHGPSWIEMFVPEPEFGDPENQVRFSKDLLKAMGIDPETANGKKIDITYNGKTVSGIATTDLYVKGTADISYLIAMVLGIPHEVTMNNDGEITLDYESFAANDPNPEQLSYKLYLDEKGQAMTLVTVFYQDIDGNELLPTDSAFVPEDDLLAFDAPEIEGYKLVSKHQIDLDKSDVFCIYEPIIDEPKTEEPKQEEPKEPGYIPDEPTPAPTPTNPLPATGDAAIVIVIVSILSAIAAAIGCVYARRRMR